MTLPVVAIVGRPNVGKSTFFNRAVGRRLAIVADVPGVTRDRNFAQSDWTGTPFFVVDTGGVVEDPDEPMDRLVRGQAYQAMDEADVILFVVDAKTGVHPLDQKLAEVLRKSQKPVLLVVNKVDNLPTETSHLDFWELGLGEPHPVSSISGRGIGDLFDVMVPLLPEPGPEPAQGDVRVAVIGKPNVGKSSLVNRLFGEERMVVSDVAGTTRDPVDLPLKYHGKTLVFVDTAGLRRQSRIDDSVEYYSSLRTARVVRDADVCLVLVDASQGISVQDIKVAEAAWEAGCGVIMVCNKWDLLEKETNTAVEIQNKAGERAPFLKAVPFVFVSALTGLRVRKLLDLILQVDETRRQRIDTHEVNEVVEKLVRRQPPPHARGRAVKIKYVTQADVEPPTFVVFANLPREIPTHYERYMVNTFRSVWGFQGSPIRLRLRKSSE